MTDTPSRTTGQRRKYPSLNLEQAIERARVLYDRERLNATPVELVARHWGFKTIKTGPASTAYSAVKQFGLLVESGSGDQRKAAISPRARAILTAPPQVRDAEIQEAALEPSMNRLVWERFQASTGSSESFTWYLVSDLGFSDTGAREFARQYEATVRFARLDERDLAIETADDTSHDVPTPGIRSLADDSRSTSSAPTASLREGSPPIHAVQPIVDATRVVPVNVSRHSIPLIGGKQVVLEGEFPITEAAWQGFMTVLSAFKPGLVADESSETSVVEAEAN